MGTALKRPKKERIILNVYYYSCEIILLLQYHLHILFNPWRKANDNLKIKPENEHEVCSKLLRLWFYDCLDTDLLHLFKKISLKNEMTLEFPLWLSGNPTSIHEDKGLVSGLRNQLYCELCCKSKMQLRSYCCYGCDVGWWLQLQLTP